MPTQIHSFPPIAGRNAKVLILGSMPGQASLAAGQYYAHPKNRFWPIMGKLLGFDADASYEIRKQALVDADIALWDVLQSCTRIGSLDTSIDHNTEIANDIPAFLHDHPGIHTVFFNGGKAEACYRRHVQPHIGCPISCHRLPSTSPAHASWSLAEKLAAWQTVKEAIRKEISAAPSGLRQGGRAPRPRAHALG
jgi:hypoxanthine-DNA glycosylase